MLFTTTYRQINNNNNNNNRQTDRQTETDRGDRQTDRQTDRQRQTEKDRERQTDRQTDRPTRHRPQNHKWRCCPHKRQQFRRFQLWSQDLKPARCFCRQLGPV
eukprot:3175920-Rhodomonas_salina.1